MGGAEVVPVAGFDRAGVERHPHPQGSDNAPRFRSEGALAGEGGGEGLGGIGEDGADGVADGLEDVALVGGDAGAQQGVVAGHRCAIAAGCRSHRFVLPSMSVNSNVTGRVRCPTPASMTSSTETLEVRAFIPVLAT